MAVELVLRAPKLIWGRTGSERCRPGGDKNARGIARPDGAELVPGPVLEAKHREVTETVELLLVLFERDSNLLV